MIGSAQTIRNNSDLRQQLLCVSQFEKDKSIVALEQHNIYYDINDSYKYNTEKQRV